VALWIWLATGYGAFARAYAADRHKARKQLIPYGDSRGRQNYINEGR